MGLHALWALALVAWPIRSSKGGAAPKKPLLTVVRSTTGHVLEIPDWSLKSGVESGVEPTTSASSSTIPSDPWVTVVHCNGSVVDDAGTPVFDVSIPADNSVRAYFEFRMRSNFPEDDEERTVYRDYCDQCELGKYNPVSLIMFGKGLVQCGCEKIQVLRYDRHGKMRRPNVIKWPMQLGME